MSTPQEICMANVLKILKYLFLFENVNIVSLSLYSSTENIYLRFSGNSEAILNRVTHTK